MRRVPGDDPPSGRFHRCTCLCPSPVLAGSTSTASDGCRFHTCRPVYRGLARIAATVRSVHPLPVRCGFRLGSAADGHGTPASFNARVIRAALCPVKREPQGASGVFPCTTGEILRPRCQHIPARANPATGQARRHHRRHFQVLTRPDHKPQLPHRPAAKHSPSRTHRTSSMSDLPDARITSRDNFRRRANPRSSRQMRTTSPRSADV
jgi:hypothetical protein